MDLSTHRTFAAAAQAFLATHDGLGHAWDECRRDPPFGGCLRIPARDDRGFDLETHCDTGEITIFVASGGVHFHMPTTTPAEIDEALAFVHDLLSPRVRLRIWYAGRSPYRWRLEVFDGGIWRGRSAGVLLLFNYVGERSSVTLQNRHLSARAPADAGTGTGADESPDPAPAADLRGLLRRDGVALAGFGALHFLLNPPGTAWSGVLLATALANLALTVRPMFVINAMVATTAGLLNLSSPSIGHKVLAVVEFAWAFGALVRFGTAEDD
jgi:hypothetical protein